MPGSTRSAMSEPREEMSQGPLMPKATAVWLVENTSLAFEQIADFCKLHPLEVKGIADGEVARDIRGAVLQEVHEAQSRNSNMLQDQEHDFHLRYEEVVQEAQGKVEAFYK